MLETVPLAEVRRTNLRYLVDQHGQAAVARSMGKPDRQIADILAGRKSFGEKVARSMESAWLRDREQAIDLDSPQMVAELRGESGGISPAKTPRSKASLVPVAGHARLGDNGWYEEIQTCGADGFVEAHSSDPDAYALRVRGDSMFPAIRDGWYVVVEPNGTPTAGEYVAIALKDGRKMVKEFLFRGTSGVSVQSVNGGARLTLLDTETLTIHAIGAVLMPSKYREI